MTSFPAEAGTVIVRIPVAFKRRGGRKLVIIPDGAAEQPVFCKFCPVGLHRAGKITLSG